MTHLFRRTATLTVFLSAATTAAFAQLPSPSVAAAADRRFVEQAAAGDAAEIALGRLASRQASRDDVKQLAQQMVDDHAKTRAELGQLAAARGLATPDSPTPAQQKTAVRLGRLSGDGFDRSYLNQMVLDHKQTVGLFRREARSGRDPELKAFATRTLPALEGHLQMVRSLQTKGGSTNRLENERK